VKKRLSAYWWCQIGGWSAYVLLVTQAYLSMGFSIADFFPPIFLSAISGIFITHLMRLFIIKTGMLQLRVLRQIIYMFLITLFFSFFHALITIWLAEILRWGDELRNLYVGKNKTGGSLTSRSDVSLFKSDCFFLGIWNLIYLSAYYIQKNRREQIEKIRLENELKFQQLESEKTKAQLERQAIELQIKAMVATQEQERKRISRDLHDDVGTKLSALNLFLSSLDEKAKCTNNNEIRSLVQSSKQFIKEAMYDIRQLLFNLSPTILEEFGYTTAVEGLVNKINETKQIHFDLVVFGINHRLKKDYELALYRITQELINNVLKHAEAKYASLQVGQRDEKIILMMEDDGKGFDVSAHKDGYGLNNLDARTKLMQGTMIIDSQPGKGTSVMVEIPYNFKGI